MSPLHGHSSLHGFCTFRSTIIVLKDSWASLAHLRSRHGSPRPSTRSVSLSLESWPSLPHLWPSPRPTPALAVRNHGQLSRWAAPFDRPWLCSCLSVLEVHPSLNLSGWHRQMASSKLILYVLSPFWGFSELLRSSFICLRRSAGRSSPLRRPLLFSRMSMSSMTIISTKQQYFRSEMCDVLLLPPHLPTAGIHWF